jgi:hypothetical protein
MVGAYKGSAVEAWMVRGRSTLMSVILANP